MRAHSRGTFQADLRIFILVADLYNTALGLVGVANTAELGAAVCVPVCVCVCVRGVCVCVRLGLGLRFG